jgi:hypothetical protein
MTTHFSLNHSITESPLIGDTTMKLVTTTIAAALLGLSLNAFAAVSDISNVTHGSQAGQELKVGLERSQRNGPAQQSQAVRESGWQLQLRRSQLGYAQLISLSG